jgi:hypothetical protein
MSQNVSLSKGQRAKITVSPASKKTAKGAEYEVLSGDCTLEDDEKDPTAKYIVASESVGQSIIKVSGKIHPKWEPKEGEEGEEGEEGAEEGGAEAATQSRRERRPKATPYGDEPVKEGEEEEEEEPETAEELIYVDVTDPNSGALGVNVGTPEDIEEEEEEEGGEGGEGAPASPDKKRRKKKDRGRKKPKK